MGQEALTTFASTAWVPQRGWCLGVRFPTCSLAEQPRVWQDRDKTPFPGPLRQLPVQSWAQQGRFLASPTQTHPPAAPGPWGKCLGRVAKGPGGPPRLAATQEGTLSPHGVGDTGTPGASDSQGHVSL